MGDVRGKNYRVCLGWLGMVFHAGQTRSALTIKNPNTTLESKGIARYYLLN